MTPFNFAFATDTVRIVYSRVPGGSERAAPSVSESYAFDIAFIGHADYPIRRGDGPTERIDIRPGYGAIHGGERIAYLGDGSAAEYVEITPSAALLNDVTGELRCRDARQLGEVGDLSDGVMWSVSSAIRRKALRNEVWDALEVDGMAHALTRHMLVTHFGGRLRTREASGLDTRRFARVTDCVEARLSEELSLDDLADVAALSRYHFVRAFKLKTGLTPFQYVSSRRVARAQALLRGTERTIAEVARQVGLSSPSHFRRVFKSEIGLTPSQYRAGFD